MIALIQKNEKGYSARFERHFKHSVVAVWAMLTNNEKLSEWFPELSVENLMRGGTILFDMQDGTYEKMLITDFEINSVLEYTWGDDLVRFEIQPHVDGCFLVLHEQIKVITSHTAKDLAGWHVCLDVIQLLLDGKAISSRKEQWQTWYEKYREAIDKIVENES